MLLFMVARRNGPDARAVIFLLKFSNRTGGKLPSLPELPSCGECSIILPPVVPHAKDGLVPSTGVSFL